MKLFFAVWCACLAGALSAEMPSAPTGKEWEDCQNLSLGKLPPRAWFGSFPSVEEAKAIRPEFSPRCRVLDSESAWRFKWSRRPSERPVGFGRPDYDVSSWDVVKVPCSWQAMGIRASGERFGVPLYMNQPYLFTPIYPDNVGCWPKVTGNKLPTDWTLGPDDNPVGSYRRDFDLPDGWTDGQVLLEFGGVESFFYLWVNGVYAGFSKDSRSPAVFDVTSLVKPGRNVVAVEVYRHSDGSYLEAQDIFRLSGILRSVLLHHRPATHLRDVAFTTTPAEEGRYNGAWKVLARVDVEGDEPHTVMFRAFDAAGREVPFAGEARGEGMACLTFRQPRLWSAEDPYLYTLVVSLEDRGRVTEAAGFQLGFRESTIRDAPDQRDRTYIFNGQPIKLKGVNRGETDPLYGHHVPDARLEEDIRLLKEGNFNHVRNSHFPQCGYFYYLCNKYGIYVMDEANIESHGYYYGEHSLSHPKEWEAAHVDRVRAMYERNKNHPCVVIWSLGNEGGPGDNFKACANWLKEHDTVRPVQYERNNWITDMGSRQYPSVEWMRDCAAGKPGLHHEPKDRELRYPFHINEYAHNFNNNCGNLMDYQDAIESSTRICGGALWDWADQALWKVTSNGVRVAAWGGCFGEKPTNGQGIMDGIVTTDRRPEPGYYEAQHVFQPFRATLDADGRLCLRNKNYFRDSSAYLCRYTVLENGEATSRGVLPARIGPQETAVVDVPAAARIAAAKSGVEAALRVEFALKEAEGLLPAGWVVAHDQVDVPKPGGSAAVPFAPAGCGRAGARPSRAAEIPPANAATLYVRTGGWTYGFSRTTGALASLTRNGRNLLCEPQAIDVFRVPVGGETHLFSKRPDFGRQRMMDGLRTLTPSLQTLDGPHVSDGMVKLTVTTAWKPLRKEDMPGFGTGDETEIVDLGAPDSDSPGYKTTCTWTFYGGGHVRFQSSFAQTGRPTEVARVGWRFAFDVPETDVAWFGRGPFDNYPDRKTACFPARWHASSLAFAFPFGRSQDGGTREETRALRLARPGLTFATLATPFSFEVSPYSTEQLIRISHPELLPKTDRTELGLYARVRGLGSNNCGPQPLARDRINPKETLSLDVLVGPDGPLASRRMSN